MKIEIKITPKLRYEKQFKSKLEFKYFEKAQKTAEVKGISFLDEVKYLTKNYPFFMKHNCMEADRSSLEEKSELVEIYELGDIEILK